MGAASAGQVSVAMARTRSFFSVVRKTTSRPTGTIMAPPIPCTTRAAAKLHSPVLKPHAMEARVKIATAAQNTLRAPYRSAMKPLAGRKTASVKR